MFTESEILFIKAILWAVFNILLQSYLLFYIQWDLLYNNDINVLKEKTEKKNGKRYKNQDEHSPLIKEKTRRSVFLMNIETKFLTQNILARILVLCKEIIHHDKVMFIAWMQGWFNIFKIKQCNTSY